MSTSGQSVVLQFGDAANDSLVHFWNSMVSLYSMRLSDTLGL